MRALSFWPSTSTAASLTAGLSVFLWSCILSFIAVRTHVSAVEFQPVPSPNLDISQLGRVAIAGDFDSISLYTFEGQSEAGVSANGSHHLLGRLPNGILASVASADGAIESMCTFDREDGSLAGVIVAGNFTSFGGIETQGIALFDPVTSDVTPLPGLTGQVSAVLCDAERSTVYVGGSFEAANSTNAIAWVTGWTNLPFSGFNGPVTSISKAADGNIIFGGAFDGLTGTTANRRLDDVTDGQDIVEGQAIPLASASIDATPATSRDGFSDPRNIICRNDDETGQGDTFLFEDNSPGSWEADFALGFVPTKLRIFNTEFEGRGTREFRFTALPIDGIMNLTFIDADGDRQFCDATCPLLPGDEVDFQDFEFVDDVGMDGFRIDVSDWYGAGAGFGGIELFQEEITSFAINEFNAPICGGASQGSSASISGPWQPSPSGESNSDYLTAQLPDGTTGGDQGDVSVSFEPPVRQSGNYSILLYTPGCLQDDNCDERGKVDITVNVQSSFDSPPEEITTELFQTNNFDKFDKVYTGFIVANPDSAPVTVTLRPSEGQDGPLTVVAQRIRLEVISTAGGLNGLFEYNPDNITSLISDKEIGSPDFSRSAINRAALEIDEGAIVSCLAVASSIPTIDPLVNDDSDDSEDTEDDDDNVSDNIIDGSTVYVGGKFASADFFNIFKIEDDEAQSLPSGGLDESVSTLLLLREGDSTVLYVGGTFTNTREQDAADLSGIAAYSVADDAWRAVGGGVNGVVDKLIPLTLNISGTNENEEEPELVFSVNGRFNRLLAFDDQDETAVDDFAIWVPSRNNWLENLDERTIAITGQLTARTTVSEHPEFLAGRVSSHSLSAGGAAALTDDGAELTAFPLKFTDREISNQFAEGPNDPLTLQNRAIVNGRRISGVATGLIYTDNDLNVTVLGGNFRAKSFNGSTIENLALIYGPDSSYEGETDDGNDRSGEDQASIRGLGEGNALDSNSTFLSLAVTGENILYAGGSVTGRYERLVSDGGETASFSINGLVAYDLEQGEFKSVQPTALSVRVTAMGEINAGVVVTSLLYSPDQSELYVGGTFDRAGLIDCNGLCIYNTESNRWESADAGFAGRVVSMAWADGRDAILLAGEIELNGQPVKLVKFNIKDREFEEFGGETVGTLPGPIVAMCAANEEAEHLWVAGVVDDSDDEEDVNQDGNAQRDEREEESFLAKFDGERWTVVRDRLSPGSQIRDLQMLKLTEDRDDSDESDNTSESGSDSDNEGNDEELIPKDETLLITGQLDIPGFGTASGALYGGGRSLRPYILTTTAANNRPGSVARIFVEKPNNFFRSDSSLALGFIVLIGLAIALALTFLLVVAGIVAERIRRRREGYVRAPTQVPFSDKYNNMRRVPPEHLFGNMGSVSGTGSGGGAVNSNGGGGRARFGGPLKL